MTSEKKTFLKWFIYWAVVLVVYITVSVIFGNFGLYSIVLILAALNFIVRIIFTTPITRLKTKWLKIALLVILNVAVLGGIAAICVVIIESGTDYNEKYINSLDYSVFEHNSEYSYDSKTGVYTVTPKGENIKILQLTDIHICGSVNTINVDRKAYDACYDLIKQAQPDLIVVTGDMIYPVPIQTLSSNNLKSIYQFALFMNNVGIPWTMVYGNHDTEAVATYNAQELYGIFRYFKDEGAPMLYADKQPDIYGRYNQYIRVNNRDGSLNRVLFLIDSNDYVEGSPVINDYDSVHEDQIEWYSNTIDELNKTEQKDVRSFVFMHIPFKAFADAAVAVENGDKDAVYLFGKNGEKVSCPDRDTGFFDKILEKGSTDAVFVGHDHLNNMAVNYKGIDLVYSKSIDYIAYPKIDKLTVQRGATLITLDPSSTYKIEQLHYAK